MAIHTPACVLCRSCCNTHASKQHAPQWICHIAHVIHAIGLRLHGPVVGVITWHAPGNRFQYGFDPSLGMKSISSDV